METPRNPTPVPMTDAPVNRELHAPTLWFTDIAGVPAEVERCEEADCATCALAVAEPLPEYGTAA